ncbi:MAG: sensor histidine kinase [Lachnospirales bacterium]
MEKIYEDERMSTYMNSANIIASYITTEEQFYETDNKTVLERAMREKANEGGFRVILLNRDSMVVSDTNNEENNNILIFQEGISAIQGNDLVQVHKKEAAVYAAASIITEDGKNVGAVLVVGGISDVYAIIDEMSNGILTYAVMFSVFIILISIIFSKFLLAPFKGILQILEKIGDGHLDARMLENRNDEFGEITRTFNKMADKLQHEEENKDHFVSNVSHELKTPLSSIKVLSESLLLQENVENEMYREFLEDINSEIDRMTNIVNDLLTLVKLDQEELMLNIEDVDVNVFVEKIVKRLRPLANQKGIELIFESISSVNIMADKTKLTLAISNLIENGIKYTEVGNILVRVDSDNQNAFITIKDTGYGIPEDELGKIFDRFYRVDKMRTRETGGTGLGLSITHSTVLLHNGSIRVSSKENVGSTFIVRLPIKLKLEEKQKDGDQ